MEGSELAVGFPLVMGASGDTGDVGVGVERRERLEEEESSEAGPGPDTLRFGKLGFAPSPKPYQLSAVPLPSSEIQILTLVSLLPSKFPSGREVSFQLGNICEFIHSYMSFENRISRRIEHMLQATEGRGGMFRLGHIERRDRWRARGRRDARRRSGRHLE